MRGGVACQAPSAFTSTAPCGAERHEGRADLAGHERARDRKHGGGEVGAGVELDSGELGELFVVRLDEVGGRFVDHGAQRGTGRVDRDERGIRAPARAHGAGDVDVEVARRRLGAANRRARASCAPSLASTTAAMSSSTSEGDEGRTGEVELRRHAVGIGDRDVRAHVPVDVDHPRGNVRGAQRGRERVVSGEGQNGDGLDPGGGDDARDVDALAAGVLSSGCRGLHLAGLQRGSEGDRAIERRIRGDGDDHASHTSTSASESAAPARRRARHPSRGRRCRRGARSAPAARRRTCRHRRRRRRGARRGRSRS